MVVLSRVAPDPCSRIAHSHAVHDSFSMVHDSFSMKERKSSERLALVVFVVQFAHAVG